MDYQVGQVLTGAKASLREVVSAPLPRFTLATLLDAMVNIHRFVENPEDKKILRECQGIGTERTRDSILETCLSRGYMEKRGQSLYPTALSLELLDQLYPALTDPATTAKWEMALSMIEEGKITREQFMTKQHQFVGDMVLHAKNMRIRLKTEDRPAIEGEGKTCPSCGKGVLNPRKVVNKASRAYGTYFLSCAMYPECNHSEWPK
jgi:DNA topoisomerase-3